MFDKIGNFSVKYRIWVILAWAVIAVMMFLFAPSLAETGTMTESNFLPQDSESLRSRELIKEYFPESVSASTASLVFYNPATLRDSDLEYSRNVQEWLQSGETPFKVATVTSIYTNPELESRLISPDRTTMLLNVGLEQVAFESESMDTTNAIRNYVNSAPEGLEIFVSGQVGIYSDLFEALDRSISLTTLVTVILVIVLLVLIFRSPVAALVPLLTIGIGYLVSRGFIGLIAQAGVAIWSQIDVFLIVLIFGIGTDYCLFLVSRFREELVSKNSRSAAMRFAVSKIGAVITASAFAVIVGMAAMAVARYQMIQTMGPILGIAIFFTLLAALTLAPALASLFGRKLFWPRHENLAQTVKSSKPGIWEKVANLSTRRPVPVICVVLVLMLIPFAALPSLTRSFDQASEIPADSESIKGYNILREHYDIGEMDPLNVLIVTPEGKSISSPAVLSALAKVGNDLQKVEGIAKIQNIVQPDGTGQVPEGFTVAGQLASVGEGITTSFTGSGNDPSIIFSDQVDAGFSSVGSYLSELQGEFPWVRDNSAYQGLNTDLAALQQTIGEARSSALVENQLKTISFQIKQLGQMLTADPAALTPESGKQVSIIKAYLDELAVEYPETRTQSSYQSAYQIAAGLESQLGAMGSLPAEQREQMTATLPGYIQQLSADFETLAGGFAGSSKYLMAQSLAQASGENSPLTALTGLFQSFSAHLGELSAGFQRNGNPICFSEALMANSIEMQNLKGTFVSGNGQATRMYLMLEDYPQSDPALNTVKRAREAVKASLEGSELSDAEVVIGGTSAEMADVRQILDQDFNIVIAVVLAATFLVLLLLLRSLIAPIYLLLTVLLSFGTTLGIVTWIFQGAMGKEGISFMIPIMVFVLLISLGSDYNIFLMSRIREESEGRPTREGARLAAIATGGVITACGIILAGTFAALVVTPIQSMLQIGVAVAIGVLIDTFIVRALLVPAVASLLGRWNWWPTRR